MAATQTWPTVGVRVQLTGYYNLGTFVYQFGGACCDVKPARLVLLADTLVDLYRRMLRIRRAEERLVKSYQEGLIPGPFRSAMGHEAAAVGVCYHLGNQDVVFPSPCGQAQALAKGLSMQAMFGEIYGRATGCSGGRGGASFLCDTQIGLLGTSGVVGSSIVQSVGAALAFHSLGEPRIAVGFFSDEAASSGAFHEGLNLAALWKLPLVLVCEHAVSPQKQTRPFPHVAAAAKAYDIPGYEVDGNDITMVYSAAFEAVRRAREGKGPSLIECAVYRLRPDSENHVHTGRPTEWQPPSSDHDPIAVLAQKLKQMDEAIAEELPKIDQQVTDEVDLAHRMAQSAPWPEE